jgi:alpha 1,6-mannosyltransferase
VFESLSELSGRENEVLRDVVSELTEPWQIDDVLILPINAFGSGQLHSGSRMPEECDPLVVHSFAGSWRPENET